MKKVILKSASIGLAFSGISYFIVSIFGYRWETLMFIMYLFVFQSVTLSIMSHYSLFNSGLTSILDRIAIIAEEEEIKVKKVVSGEKYKIKGDVERI